MHSAAVALFSLGLGWCAIATAEAQPPRVVTLDEALAAAESVPEVVAARAMERAAAAGIRDARAPGDPSLSLATRSVSARESLSVSIPFRWGGQKGAAVSQAEAELVKKARSLEAAIALARRACRVAWFTLAGSEDRLRAETDLLARSETNRRAIADLFELQRASRLDSVRATTEAAMAKASRTSAEQGVIAASAELRALLGLSDGRLTAGEGRPTPPPEGPLEAWRERAHGGSPEVQVAEAELRAADARVTRKARDKRPATSLTAGADWNDPTQPGTDALLGLGITFPTHGRAGLDAAHAERDRAAALLDLARRRAEVDLESAWSAAGAARQRFEALDQVAGPAAAEAAELTRVGYTEGKLDLFRLLDAEHALADARRDHAEAYREWGVAFAALERLVPESHP